MNKIGATELIGTDTPFFICGRAVFTDSRLKTANEKLVYMCLCEITHRQVANLNGYMPSFNEIAKLTSLSRSTIVRVIKSLEEGGLLTRSNQFKDNIQRANAYILERNLGGSHRHPMSHRHTSVSERPTDRNIVESKEEVIKNRKVESIPTLDVFTKYLVEYLPKLNPDWTSERSQRVAELTYETWVDNDWKDGHDKPIKNWKTKARNVISHKKPWNYGVTPKPKSNFNTPSHHTSQIINPLEVKV